MMRPWRAAAEDEELKDDSLDDDDIANALLWKRRGIVTGASMTCSSLRVDSSVLGMGLTNMESSAPSTVFPTSQKKDDGVASIGSDQPPCLKEAKRLSSYFSIGGTSGLTAALSKRVGFHCDSPVLAPKRAPRNSVKREATSFPDHVDDEDEANANHSEIADMETKEGGRRGRGGGAGGGGWRAMSLRGQRSRFGTRFQSMARTFSIIEESADPVFWSTLFQGFTVLPFFMLASVIINNTMLGYLFVAVVDIPHLQGLGDWIRMPFSLFGGILTLRNIFVSMYELTMDSTTLYPLLNPTLLRRIRSIVAVYPGSLVTIVTVINFSAAIVIFYAVGLGVRIGPFPEVWLKGRWLFLINAFIKFTSWHLYQRFEAHCKQAKAFQMSRPDVDHLAIDQQTDLRRYIRRKVITYFATSDVLLMVMFIIWHAITLPSELEHRVLIYNVMALAITNSASLGMFSFEALNFGPQLLERSRWTDAKTRSSHVSIGLIVLFYLISVFRHGVLPAFFTLLVVYNGLSICKCTIWSCVEVIRSCMLIRDSLKFGRVGWSISASLVTYCLITRNRSDAIVIIVTGLSVFWSKRVLRRTHVMDYVYGGLVVFASIMAFHQAFYVHMNDGVNDLYQISLDSQNFNITSKVGRIVFELEQPHNPLMKGIKSGSSSSSIRPQYPFCDMKVHGLSLMEFASLSFLAYLKKDSDAFNAFNKAVFDQREWKLIHAPDDRHAGAVFIDMYNSRLDQSIVAVRGTNPKNIFDIFQDAVLFNSAFTWDITGLLVPFVRWIPQQWTANLLYLSYLPLQMSFDSVSAYRDLQLHYHNEIEEYVRQISKERKVVLTGHSLGGGIAKIVSAKLGIPIFAISSPGIALSHKIFGVSLENINRYETNLINSEDLVPKVDRLKGLIMKMSCSMTNSLDCHLLDATMCELHSKCGAQFGARSKVGGRILGCTRI